MTNEEMLAQLTAQASGQGSDIITLRAIIEEAADLGAERALGRSGLDEANMQGELGELRQLLAAWRAAKASTTETAIKWAIRAGLALLLITIALRLGVTDLLR